MALNAFERNSNWTFHRGRTSTPQCLPVRLVTEGRLSGSYRSQAIGGHAPLHLLRISGARKSLVAIYRKAIRLPNFAPSLMPRREIRDRADPHEHGAVFSVQHLFCSSRGERNFGLTRRPARCKFAKDRGSWHPRRSKAFQLSRAWITDPALAWVVIAWSDNPTGA
jgi:hypothetical protein